MTFLPALLAASLACAGSDSLLLGIIVFCIAGIKIEYVQNLGAEMT